MMEERCACVRISFDPCFEQALANGTKTSTVREVDMGFQNSDDGRGPVHWKDQLLCIGAPIECWVDDRVVVRGRITALWDGPLAALPVEWYTRENVRSFAELFAMLQRFYPDIRGNTWVVAIAWEPEEAPISDKHSAVPRYEDIPVPPSQDYGLGRRREIDGNEHDDST